VVRGDDSNCSINTLAELWSLGIKVRIYWLLWLRYDNSDDNSDGDSNR
jgi:hypothetical protein